ncbi:MULTISPECIES: amidinotransferase [Streptomyces]|uniref:Amidinotransferase n=1 Tax=Streptomyces rhizosphaericola TaxID=2564098 RepID=A0ABY2PEK1_9ACTN|nr:MULTISPECIES: amidinotransferase [Streptomyces]ARI54731.1 amidinotransferase [Streptomyces sp. S8]MYT93987.1 amidinotransferase [Streptomyces sp. SID8359]MYU00557.1 amidinotransferase [Streptomyces sp. SID8350]PWS42854.1 amidinotransferase [Streptomyces sp. ZEA17I]TGZ09471.1 amidinotransferase [Streptomyces rhizosphaericola]
MTTLAQGPGVPESEDAAPLVSPVNSHNEWDPLEEIIVGRLDDATIPSSHPVVSCNIPPWAARFQGLAAGYRYPRRLIEPAQEELDGFVSLLTSLGITVTRPDAVDHRQRFATPGWTSRGFCNTCPRDSMLVIGDEIIETPMAWPCRYFETHSYRRILKDYFRRGARWTSAPKPQLTDELFEREFRTPKKDEPMRYILTEFEPVFDAADFVRAGRDLFVTRSNVTNAMGIEWLRRHLGPGYRIHEIESRCRTPMHIDTTFLVLKPGKALVNPEYIDVDRLPPVLDSWDILVAPEPEPVRDLVLRTTSMCGKWLSMNILMVDEKRVIAERHHTGMLRALEGWGFEPIPCDLMHYAPFGGSFHCATLDVRRRGTLESYVD